MPKKKMFFKIVPIFIMIIFTIYSSCYATIVETTRENLEQAFQNIIQSQEKEFSDITEVKVEDNIINITTANTEYQMKYDLTNNPTFTTEMNIKDGMSYDEYQIEELKLKGNILGYSAIANLNNVEAKSAFLYFSLTYADKVLSNDGGQSNGYIIVDDRDSDVDANITSSGEKTIIKASEFGNYAMDYACSTYKPITINDGDSGDTYQLNIEQQDVTDTSCKIVFTLTVKKDADFSAISAMGNNTENEDNLSQNEQNQEQNSNNINRNDKDNTISITQLPKAGTHTLIYVILVVLVLIIIFRLKYRKLKDVK